REEGGEGRIALISKDATLPYHRPPLSKKFLRGQTHEEPLVEDERFYADHGVEVMLETAVRKIDTGERTGETETQNLRHSARRVARGCRPRRPPVPGAQLQNVFTPRPVAPSKAIPAAAASAERCAIVGAGFIGMEVA